MKINAIEPQNAFTGMIDDFTDRGKKQTRDAVIEHSSEKYGAEPKDVGQTIMKQSTEPVITKNSLPKPII